VVKQTIKAALKEICSEIDADVQKFIKKELTPYVSFELARYLE
jgi:hypothetical protein